MRFKYTYEIKAPIEFVYYQMFDQEIMKQVVPGLISFSLEELKSGCSYTMTTYKTGELTTDIVEVQPPVLTHLRFQQGSWIFNAIDHLQSSKQGTRITTEIIFETRNTLALLLTPIYYLSIYLNSKVMSRRYMQAIEEAYQHSF